MIASNALGQYPLGQFPALTTYVSDDTILRTNPITRAYQLEVAWGGDLTQLTDDAGEYVCTISGDTQHIAPISGSNCSFQQVALGAPSLTGNNQHSNYRQLTVGTPLVLIFASSVTVNEFHIYQYPLQGFTKHFKLEYSTDGGSTYVTVSDVIDADSRHVLKLQTAVSINRIRYTAYNGGENGARLVALEAYYFSDETEYITEADSESGEPTISISGKLDANQNSLPSFSECVFELDNISNRFSQYNSGSSIYGILQADGKGSGVRTGCPVRVTATANDGTNYFSKVVFYGYISDDNDPGGSSGINYDFSSGIVEVSCKSFLSLLEKEISLPVFQGAFFDQIIREACYRSGIADQNLVIPPVGQNLPYEVLEAGTAREIINSMLEVLPFLRVKENYDPPSVEIVPAGRFRADGLPVPGGYAQFVIPFGKYLFLSQTSSNNIYKWDTSKSVQEGIELYTSSFTGSTIQFWDRYLSRVYVISGAGAVTSFDPSIPYLSTTHGSFSDITGGYTTLISACMYDKFIFCQMSNGATVKVFVWDVTLPFSTCLNKGTGPVAAPGTRQASGANADYFVVTNTLGDSETFFMWFHDGDPMGATFDMTHEAANFLDGYVGTPSDISMVLTSDNSVVAVVSTSAANTNPEIIKINLDTVYATGTTVGTRLGFVPRINSGDQEQVNALLGGMVAHGTYVYIITNSNNILVYDTTKDISSATYIGIGSFTSASRSRFYRNELYLSMGTNGVVDDNKRVYVSSDAVTSISLVGFQVQSTANTQPTALAAFELSDEFTVAMKLQDGNPSSNLVRLTNTLDQLETEISSLWEQPSRPIWLNPGTVTITNADISTSFSDSRYLAVLVGAQTGAITRSGSTATFNKTSHGIPTGAYVYITGADGAEYNGLHGPITATANAFTYTVSGTPTSPDTGTASVYWCVPDDATDTTTIGNLEFCFWANADKAWIAIDNNSTLTSISSMLIVGYGMTSSEPFTVDKKSEEIGEDLVIRNPSRSIYHRDYPKEIQSNLLGDPSTYQDILNDGKYAKIYAEDIQTPWYPLISLAMPISITDDNYGLSAGLFQVMEYQVDGFRTSFKAVQVFESQFV